MVSTRLSSNRGYDLNMKHPWFSYAFKEDGRLRFVADFFVPLLSKKNFCPFVTNNGKTLHLWTMLPEFFYDQYRLLRANAPLTDFNENTHRNTSYEDLLKYVNKKRTAKQELYSKDTIINLPFQVEEYELEWKLLIFWEWWCGVSNNLQEITPSICYSFNWDS